jgi:predicted MFS family arabinose efflux permease
MNSDSRWQRNLMLLNAMSFFRTFMIIMPIFVPLMQRYGLSMQETMWLQSIFAGVTLILELPSGFIADVFGRKITLIVGFALAGIGFSQILWADTFIELAIFEATLGLAVSLVSGTDMSFAFESEKALNEKESQTAIGHLMSWMNFGEAASAICAFVILKFDVLYILWVQAIVGWVPFLLSFWLTEPPRSPSFEKKHMREALRIIRRSSVLPTVTLVFVVTMSATYLIAWLNQNLWQLYRLPLEYFGLVWGFLGLSVGLSARFSSRLPDRFGSFSIFSLLAVLLLVGYIFLTMNSLAFVLVGALCVSIFRGIAAPKIKLRVNNAIDNSYRATINSLVGASFRVSTFFLGPLMGYVVDQYGPAAAANGLLLLILPAMFGLYMMDHITQKKGFNTANS